MRVVEPMGIVNLVLYSSKVMLVCIQGLSSEHHCSHMWVTQWFALNQFHLSLVEISYHFSASLITAAVDGYKSCSESDRSRNATVY